jgi:hypothetical protein
LDSLVIRTRKWHEGIMENRAEGQSQEPQRTIARMQDSALMRELATCASWASELLWASDSCPPSPI